MPFPSAPVARRAWGSGFDGLGTVATTWAVTPAGTLTRPLPCRNVQITIDREEEAVRGLHHRHVADAVEDLEPPLWAAAHQLPGGGHGHQAVARAMEDQRRGLDSGQHPVIGLG